MNRNKKCPQDEEKQSWKTDKNSQLVMSFLNFKKI